MKIELKQLDISMDKEEYDMRNPPECSCCG